MCASVVRSGNVIFILNNLLTNLLECSVNAPKDQRPYERGPNGGINYKGRNVKNYLVKEKRGLWKLMVAMQVDSG